MDKLPGRFEELVRLMPPQAIADDHQLENTTGMIDRLMAIPKLSKGQRITNLGTGTWEEAVRCRPSIHVPHYLLAASVEPNSHEWSRETAA